MPIPYASSAKARTTAARLGSRSTTLPTIAGNSGGRIAKSRRSDFDCTLRESVKGAFAISIRNNDLRTLMPKIREGVARRLMLCRTDNFIAEALQRRSSRTIGDLEKLKSAPHHAKISGDTLVRHNPQAICHLMGNEEKIDFSFPGGHIYVHTGVEESLKFMADKLEFRVRDIPGIIGDDIRYALVNKLVASGF